MQDLPLAVIDDEPAIRRIVMRVFSRREFVTGYASAEQFFETFDSSRPHLLIVDKNLPGQSGLELVEAHRRLSKSEFEAVLITGYADADSAMSAMKLGIYSYLRKPFQTEELVYALAGAEERLKLRLQLKQTEARLHDEEHRLGETIGGFAEDLRALQERQVVVAMTERLSSLGRVAASVASELERSFLATEEQLLTGLLPSIQAAAAAVVLDPQGAEGQVGAGSAAEEAAAQVVQDHLRRMRELADDLRVLTDEGAYDAVIDLRQAVRVGTRMAEALVERLGQLEVSLPDAPVQVYGSQQHLAQVVINLLLNAADAIVVAHAPPAEAGQPQQLGAGRVQVSLASEEPYGVLTVSDNGCGIDPSRLHEIFEPFVGNKREGKGIGLTIVRSIVAAHQGQLTIDSELDRGTTIAVSLPLARRSKTDRLNTIVGGGKAAGEADDGAGDDQAG